MSLAFSNKVAFSSATDAALLQSEYIALVAEPNLAGVGDRVLQLLEQLGDLRRRTTVLDAGIREEAYSRRPVMPIRCS
jgi:hypothetical protein